MPRRLRHLVVDLASRGRHHFTTAEATTALGVSIPAVRASLRRLEAHGEIASPFRGFYVIVPPEYRRLGCMPPEQFVPQLMAHLGETYYVALLSAAELHGAAHQRPQRFQVMVATNRRPLVCGDVQVQFVARKDLEQTPVVEQRTPRGPLLVASPEATALELVGYADQCGGLEHVVIVLTELAETMDRDKLLTAACKCPIAWVQRLGYLLDRAGHATLADVLASHVATNAQGTAPLVRAASKSGAHRESRWKLAINADIEVEP